ncbi:MAG: WD40/YVTN/BNR-like repeat-containing protein [Burkholderiales bacterium]
MPHLYIGSNGLSLWTSADNGETLSRMSTGTGLYSGSQVWSLASHPARSKELLVGADTGLHRLDRSTGACRLVPSPMDGTLVTAIAYAPSDPNTIFAGTQPAGLYRSHDAGKSWTKLNAAIKPHVDTGFPGADVLQSNKDANADILVKHWTRVTDILPDPDNPQQIWAGVEIDGVWRSVDGGEHWTRSSKGLITDDIHGLTLVRNGLRKLFAATNKGLHVSVNEGANWQFQRIDSPWQYSRDIVERADGSGVMFLTNGDGPPGTDGRLHRSRDFGATWERVALPAEIQSSVYFLATNPADANLIFVATNLGQLFRSTDGGETFIALKRRLGEIRCLLWLPD